MNKLLSLISLVSIFLAGISGIYSFIHKDFREGLACVISGFGIGILCYITSIQLSNKNRKGRLSETINFIISSSSILLPCLWLMVYNWK